MKEGQRLWTREELILAINLYVKLSFGQMHQSNLGVVKLAELIGRTPGSVAFKLVNFASLDPSLKARGIKGAVNTSKLDKEIWNEFYNQWGAEIVASEVLRLHYENVTPEEAYSVEEEEVSYYGEMVERKSMVRMKQGLFREMVMSAYNHRCCITGLEQSELLVAGHIRPWGKDENNRLNPSNGLVLNALHDKAFENGYLTITPDYEVKIAPLLLKKPELFDLFGRYDNQPIILPDRFLPGTEFLKYHNQERFKS